MYTIAADDQLSLVGGAARWLASGLIAGVVIVAGLLVGSVIARGRRSRA